VGGGTGGGGFRATPWHVTMAVIYFSGSSLFSIFVNKAILSGFGFGYPTTLMMIQMLGGVVMLAILRAAKVIHVPPLKSGHKSLVITPTVAWISNVLLGLYALKLVNIPMFSTLRRLSMLFVMIAEYYAGRQFSTRIVVSILIIVFGSVCSALGDISFDGLGYFLVFVNNLITAVYFNSLKRALNLLGINALQLYYYTSLFGFPAIFLVALVTDLGPAYSAIQTNINLQGRSFLIALLMSIIFSFSVNYSTNLTTHYTSPLTAAVSSQIKNFLQTGLGMLSWGYQFSVLNVSGLVIAVIGSFMYSIVRYRETQEEETRRKIEIDRSTGSDSSAVDVPLTRGQSTKRGS